MKCFGLDFEMEEVPALTLCDFEDLILFCLEDYLFKTKFNDKILNIAIPSIGLYFSTSKKYALDLRGYLNIPQFSFDVNGCLYSDGKEAAYVSPEFFAKCFIQRTIDVWTSILKLYLPKINKSKNRGAMDFGDDGDEKKQKLSHINFVELYNKLIELNTLNQDLTKGLIGLIPDWSDSNRILNLRKIEMAAQIQTDIEYVLNNIRQELFVEMEEDDYYSSLSNNEEYKSLIAEHGQLFRIGPFIEALEPQEWETANRKYDYGTDEQRKDWRRRYNELKQRVREESSATLKSLLDNEVFALPEIQKKVIDYLKKKIVSYYYNRYSGDYNNPLKTELGLDRTLYYAHPADKYKPVRLSATLHDLEYLDEGSYDELYIYSNFDEGSYGKSTFKKY